MTFCKILGGKKALCEIKSLGFKHPITVDGIERRNLWNLLY